jgi:TolB protein
LVLSIAIIALAADSPASSSPLGGPTGRVAFVAEVAGASRVVVADAAGAKRLDILRYPRDSSTPPAFSPDGRNFAYWDGDAVAIARVDGTSVRRIPMPCCVEIGKPAWSPDSRTIVVNVLDDIYLFSADGTGKRKLFHEDSGGGVREAAWSPDGRRIAFGRFVLVDFPVFHIGIYVIGVDGKNGRWLRRGVEAEYLSWSPDGRQLAYEDGKFIYRIIRDGKGKRRLAAGEEPSWSPDGRYIAFSRTERKPSLTAPENSIWTMKADGSNQRRVWPQRGLCECGHPDWMRT